jgi:hypothetical protein
MMNLRINQLIEFVDDARTERVLWGDRQARGYFTIDIAEPVASPIFRKADEIADLVAEGRARHTRNDPWSAPLNEDALSEDHKAKRDKSWEMIRRLVDEQPSIFSPKGRARIIRRMVEEDGVSRHSLYRLLRRYWQRGMTPNAFLPDYDRCGGRGKSKSVSERKRGRPASSGVEGMNVDTDTRTLFFQAITLYYAKKRKLDLGRCYEDMIGEYYTDLVIDENTGLQKPILRNHYPSRRQFRYWFERDKDVFQIERQRRIPRVYDKEMLAPLSSSTSEVIDPGCRYQIDATIIDLYLVSRFNRKRIASRPVLYIVIDVFSRMIVGLYLGFEGPSWVGALMAIANAVSDKVAYCHQFGIDINDADWPCHHLPDILLGDRGEMLSSSVEALVKNFHVRVENAAPYRTGWEGIVERRFRLIPAAFKDYTLGYIARDCRERGAPDHRLDGKLDIDELTVIIIECIRYYNNKHVIHNYERDRQMIADGVKPIPIELWEWGVARRTGLQRSFQPELVKLSLLPSDDAVVTPKGIRFYGCYYTFPKAISEHWFKRARQKRNWKVRISYDPRSLDEIYLHGAGRGEFFPCSLTDVSAAFRGWTLWEIDQTRKEERRQQNAAKQGRATTSRLKRS